MESVLVLDNGGAAIKIGAAGGECQTVFNGIARSRDRRVFMANEIAECRDFSSLLVRRPVERGHLASWELQKAVWDWTFDHNVVPNLDITATALICTETPYTLPASSVHTDQIVFEEYGFYAYRRCSAASLVPWNDTGALFGASRAGVADACLVIDSGFNATHIVPVVRGHTKFRAVRRVDVAGKVLTNYLKETVSFRYYNMMDETYLLNAIKEELCFVSTDFAKDLTQWKNNKRMFDRGYLLPDHKTNRLGRVITDVSEIRQLQKDEHQVLTLGNERFAVPEALFDPREVDFDQAGVTEAVAQSINAAPPETQALLWANIVLTGGTARLPNFVDRLQRDLRLLAPQDATVRVASPADPVTYAWQGGAALGRDPAVRDWLVTRQEYLESGESACLRKFGKNPGAGAGVGAAAVQPEAGG